MKVVYDGVKTVNLANPPAGVCGICGDANGDPVMKGIKRRKRSGNCPGLYAEVRY